MAKAIIPKKPLIDVRAMTKAVEATLDELAEGAEKDFGQTTRTWRTAVDFPIDKRPFYRAVSTDNLIYGYVSRGTRPHLIAPRNAKALKIGQGWAPKTKVAVIGSSAGRSPSSYVYRRKPVRHPGTTARDFDKAIAKKWQSRAPRMFQSAISRAAR